MTQLLHGHQKLNPARPICIRLDILVFFCGREVQQLFRHDDNDAQLQKRRREFLKIFSFRNFLIKIPSIAISHSRNLTSYTTLSLIPAANQWFPNDFSSSDKNASTVPSLPKNLIRQHTNDSKPPSQTQPRTRGGSNVQTHRRKPFSR